MFFEWPCNLTISYASHFVPSRSDVSFSFYNQFHDRVCCLVAFSKESVKDEKICVKSCLKVGEKAAETHNMLHDAYGNDASSQRTTYEWFKRFKNGGTSTDNDEQSGRLSTSNPNL
jgi:hypothetical protein